MDNRHEYLKSLIISTFEYFNNKSQTGNILNELFKMLIKNKSKLPIFPSDNYLDITNKKGLVSKYYTEKIRILDIPISHIYGNTWLFINDRSNLQLDKISRLLLAILCGQKTPPIDVAKFGDKYITSDGNHRIYSSYIMGIEKVSCIISSEILPRENK